MSPETTPKKPLLDQITHSKRVNQSKNGDQDIDSDSLKGQERRKKLEDDRYKKDTDDRQWLAKWTAAVVSVWLAGVLAIVTLNEILQISLSDSVLMVLLGTTTLNVLGMPLIVLRGHFNHK